MSVFQIPMSAFQLDISLFQLHRAFQLKVSVIPKKYGYLYLLKDICI